MTSHKKVMSVRNLALWVGLGSCVASLLVVHDGREGDTGELINNGEIVVGHLRPGGSYSIEVADLKPGDPRGLILRWSSSDGELDLPLASMIHVSAGSPGLQIERSGGGGEVSTQFRVGTILPKKAADQGLIQLRVSSDFPETQEAVVLLERPFIEAKSAFATAPLNRWNSVVRLGGSSLLLFSGLALILWSKK